MENYYKNAAGLCLKAPVEKVEKRRPLTAALSAALDNLEAATGEPGDVLRKRLATRRRPAAANEAALCTKDTIADDDKDGPASNGKTETGNRADGGDPALTVLDLSDNNSFNLVDNADGLASRISKRGQPVGASGGIIGLLRQ